MYRSVYPSNMESSLIVPELKSINTIPVAVQYLVRPCATEIVLLAVSFFLLAAFISQGKIWDRPDPYGYIYFERPQVRQGALNDDEPAARDIARDMDNLDKDFVIFWGSQSGTAENLAHRLSRDLFLRFDAKVMVADLSDYSPASICSIPSSKLIVFILSTYGEGGPSDNAVEFFDWASRADDPCDVSGLRVLAFGLGNSNYKFYNKVVDVVVEKLTRAGASMLLPVAKADDADESTEEDYLAWVEQVHDVFERQLKMQPRLTGYTPTLSIEDVTGETSEELVQQAIIRKRDESSTSLTVSAIKALPVHSSANMSHQVNEWNCLHMELDLTGFPELRYKTGDHLAVWPVNPDEEVNRLLKILGREETADAPVAFHACNETDGVKVASPTTLRVLLQHQLELCAPVSRNCAMELAQFAPIEEAKAFLSNLGRNRDAFASFRSRMFLTLGRLMEHASDGACWPNLPLSWVIETLPTLQPRYYSISSSSVLSPRRLSVTVRVSNDSLPNNPAVMIPGLATNYLHGLSRKRDTSGASYHPDLNTPIPLSLQTGHVRIHAQIRRTRFKPPTSPATPIIMIANGTGIAPFRAFVLERAKLHSIGRTVGRMVLFFGCRRPSDGSFLYRDELESAARSLNAPSPSAPSAATAAEGGAPKQMVINAAFSRLTDAEVDDDGCAGAVVRGYVQDAVERDVDGVIHMLAEDGASVYICGGAAMGREVGQRIARGYERVKGLGGDESTGAGAEWVASIKRKGKWKEDVWD